MDKKKFVFAVQGEGRGHLTQAISLYEGLVADGHTVCCMIVGSSSARALPEFVRKKISSPIVTLESPNFSFDKHGRGVKAGKTAWKNLLKLRSYKASLDKFRQLINQHQPDIVINFYEPLVAMHNLLYKHSFKTISIAHQYVYLHRDFRFPVGFGFQSAALKWYTRFTASGSDKLMALSMYDTFTPGLGKLVVCPPLLRKEVFQLTPMQEDFILVYLVNSGYMHDLILWHKKNPLTKLVCFTDSRDVKERYNGIFQLDETLTFYSLDDQKFLSLMAKCRGVVSTAGFESVCESMYLGKPIMMVPVEGHFEQYCNAWDAERIGAGISAKQFNLDSIEKTVTPRNTVMEEQYRNWVNKFTSTFNEVMRSLYPDLNSQSN
jgi:uncharacterized protein (TIGR00661 family)